MFNIAKAQKRNCLNVQQHSKSVKISFVELKGALMSIQSTITQAKTIRQELKAQIEHIHKITTEDHCWTQETLKLIETFKQEEECHDKLEALQEKIQYVSETGLEDSYKLSSTCNDTLECANVLCTIVELQECRDALVTVDMCVSEVINQCNNLYDNKEMSLLKAAYSDCAGILEQEHKDTHIAPQTQKESTKKETHNVSEVLYDCINTRLLSEQKREERKDTKIEKLSQTLNDVNSLNETLKHRIIALKVQHNTINDKYKKAMSELEQSKSKLKQCKNDVFKHSVYSGLIAGISVATCAKLKGTHTQAALTSAAVACAGIGAMLYTYNTNN